MLVYTILLLIFFFSNVLLYDIIYAPYAEWAHDHVVWLNGAHQNQSLLEQLVLNYTKYNITVGGLNIDSGWSKKFNDFIWDYSKFPNPEQFIKKMHSLNIKVILLIQWVTSIINNDSQLYQEGKKLGYFLNKGALIKWWHGHGAFIDFTNPKAKQWWNTLMDRVLDLGFDGWKCDGTDPMIVLLKPFPYSFYSKRIISLHEYGDLYYGSIYNYTRYRNPTNGLIMSRPVDSFHHKLYRKYSPKYVMFAGWVGDQDSSLSGLQQALYNIIHSAWAGYLNFGCDIGGYRGQYLTKNVYLRWVQLGALLPYMQNGGNGRHAPWQFDSQTIDIYRKFVQLHLSLKSFFLTAGTQAYMKHVSVIEPIANKFQGILLNKLSTFCYQIWHTFLISPIVNQNGYSKIRLPKESNWCYYFNMKKIFQGGTTLELIFPINQMALFVRIGAIYPQNNWIVFIYPSMQSTTIIRTFIHAEYNDVLQYNFGQQCMKLIVNRYYFNQKNPNKNATIMIKMIGLTQIGKIKLLNQTNTENKIKIQQKQIFHEFIIPINNTIIITKIKFSNLQYSNNIQKIQILNS